MSENNEKNLIEDAIVVSDSSSKTNNGSSEFKLFKCCSATLKRLSVLLFVVNLFLAVTAAVVAVIAIIFYIGLDMVSLLAVPIVCLVAVMVVIARLVSALVYGFALIVEKHEKD